VLPSPNGSTLAACAESVSVLAGCLRNATAVAKCAAAFGPRVAVIPAGERWPDGSLRVCLEDWIGAGAVLDRLAGTRSPEAEAAVAIFHRFRANLRSGKELVERGYSADVELAAESDVSSVAPLLVGGCFAPISARR
jgi:2-phosphosulfolactate phosphatase